MSRDLSLVLCLVVPATAQQQAAMAALCELVPPSARTEHGVDCAAHACTWKPAVRCESLCQPAHNVRCDSATGEVTHISMRAWGLMGSIPTELGELTALTTLDLFANSLSGTIPSEIGGSTALRWLTLSVNSLSGSIPSELGGLTALNWIFLNANSLTGTFPFELGRLTALKWLNLRTNSLTGTIPSEMGGLTALNQLDLPTTLSCSVSPYRALMPCSPSS